MGDKNMLSRDLNREDLHRDDLHPADRELLQSADGELPSRRTAQVHAHLAACWDCRARMGELGGTITDFGRAHRQALDRQVPAIAGPRALLRAQLAELAAKPPTASWRWLFQFNWATRATAFACAALFVAAIAGSLLFRYSPMRAANSTVAS